MKKGFSLLLCCALILLTSTITFATDSTNNATSLVTENRQEIIVYDGQAITISQIGDSQSGVVDLDAFDSSQCIYENDKLTVDGDSSMEVQSSEPMPRQGYTRTQKPAFGVSSDYTVDQGTTKKNYKLSGIIRSLSALAIATALGIATGGIYLSVAVGLLDIAIGAASNSQTAYSKEHKYGHKTIPGLYHKYVQKWYIDSAYSKYACQSVVYDYWS